MALIKRNLIFLFSFLLPLHQKFSTIVLLLLVLVSLLSYKKNEKIDVTFIPFMLPMALYVLLAISLLYSENVAFKYLEQRAALLAMPVIFFTIKWNVDIHKRALRYFVLGCVVAVLLCYLNAFYNSIQFVDGVPVFQAVVNKEFSFFYAVVRDGNYFFSSFFSIFHDTIYFAIYLNVALGIVLSLSLWKDSKWYFVLLLLFPLVIFQLSSKAGIIICFIVFLMYFVFKVKRIVIKTALCFLIIIFGYLFFKHNPRGKIMVDKIEKEGIKINPNEKYGFALRLMSWDAAIELVGEYPLKGLGVGDVEGELNKKYAEKGYKTPLKNSLNTHNAFLQIALEGGLLTFLVIIGMLWCIFKALNVSKELYFFNLSFLIAIFVVFSFESFLNRYSGLSLFMFFYCAITHRSLGVSKE